MERVIRNMELYNNRTNVMLGDLYDDASGRIVAADNLGTQDITIHWQLDARGETRQYKHSNVKPSELKITVLSNAYDAESKLGDEMYIQLIRNIAGQRVVNRMYGILCAIERDRFSRNDSTLYSTAYTVYVDNPLWRYGVFDYPATQEEAQMKLVETQTGALTSSSTTLSYVLSSYHTNVTRGVKFVFTPTLTTVTYPFDIELDINGYVFTITITAVPGDIVFVFGESAVYCNCEMADKGVVRTQALDAYGNFSLTHINPIQWDNKPYTIKFRALSEVDGIMQASLYMIQGEYF
jgi:hypothetical protein